jgi:hypothetical protein
MEYGTLIERKSRMAHIRGIKGEAVVVYCEPLITRVEQSTNQIF